uniref:Techylectin-5B n=1 Tax=Cacopsylla melanoneura TaxID=428564 RepID=A0A8D9BUB0_9HEMI
MNKLVLFTCLGLVFVSLDLCLAAETSETRSATPRRVRNSQVIIRAVNTGKSISTSSSVSSSSKNSSVAAGPVSQASTVYTNPLYTRVSPSQANGTSSQQSGGNGKSTRNREQVLLNVFEIIVSTLESKLQRIENLDKAVEHLMRKIENIETKINENNDKTDIILSRMKHNGETKSHFIIHAGEDKINERVSDRKPEGGNNVDKKLSTLDEKVSNIDLKLNILKNQLDSNMLPLDDINAEASEKKPQVTSFIEVSKTMTAELDAIRSNTANIDRKLQFHINLVSENIGKILHQLTDVHEAIVENVPMPRNKSTTTQSPLNYMEPVQVVKKSKIDRLVRQMNPILSVSEKMDEVWDVVVGTKSSVDDLLPKSDELLNQTQRQERAINDIHADLKQKTNKIIANLDVVEKRLKKQEDDVVTLAQRPVAAELLLDPTIDRLVEYDQTRYDQNRYSVISDELPPITEVPQQLSNINIPTLPTPNPVITSVNNSTNIPPLSIIPIVAQASQQILPSAASFNNLNRTNNSNKNRGFIFPSIKNKPNPANTTFTTDQLLGAIKDIKGYSCLDLLNGGMRHSGVFYLQIRGTTYWFLKVFCEQEVSEGGWTVIQRRDDFGEPRENFNRDWNDYKNGFGDPSKEFWMGNENIYMLTNNEEYMLRIELEDFEGNRRYAQYSHFKIYSEGEYYKLEIDGYEGNAGDSLNDPWYGSNNSPFSTYNRDNDRSSLNCASMLKGGWWWKSCGRGLNGLYLNDPQDLTARQGIVWFRWRGWDYTLKKASMMIRPKGMVSSV